MGYYEFPHTRNYDTDLGYLIKRYFELSTDFESLEKNFNDLKAWCIAQLNSEALKTLVATKLDDWLSDGTLAALINNPLNHVTTYDTVVEMLTHSGLLEGSKIYCAGADKVNDKKGGHFRIRARLSTDVIDNYNLYLIDGGVKVAERIEKIASLESYGAKGDGITDDTQAFINAINENYYIVGDLSKTYKINETIVINATTDKTIKDCHFLFEAYNAAESLQAKHGITVSANEHDIIFDNCKFESEYLYTPVINLINGENTGIASNIQAIVIDNSLGLTHINNCEFKHIFGVHTNSNCIITNTNFNNVEMGISQNDYNSILTIDNSNIKLTRLTNSIYYHSFYIQKSKGVNCNNITIEEVDTGLCGNHLHCYSTDSTITNVPLHFSNVIFNGDLHSEIAQSGIGTLTINNLNVNGHVNSPFTMSKNGFYNISNANFTNVSGIIFNGRNESILSNSIFNGDTFYLTDRCSIKMDNCKLIASETLGFNDPNVQVGTEYILKAANCIFDSPTFANLNYFNQYNYISDCLYNIKSTPTSLQIDQGIGLIKDCFFNVNGLTDFTNKPDNSVPFEVYFYSTNSSCVKSTRGIN